jgi:hypothetical protein
VVVRDDRGGGCAVALLGWHHYQGVKAVVDVGRQAQHCRGRRAAETESTTMTRTADNTTRGEGWTMTTSGKNGCLTKQAGNNDGGNDGGWDVMLRASYSQRFPKRV